MLYSIKGKVTFQTHRSIVVENYGLGYEILVISPESYSIGEEVFLFIHHEVKEFYEYLVGFNSKDEKEAFNLLLHVNGIGPKSALLILSNVNYDELLTAISNNDLDFIRNIPGVGDRAANQMLLDLKGYIAKSNKDNSKQYNEVKAALKALKYTVKQIDKVLPTIYMPNASNQEIIKEALRRIHYVETYGQK